MDDHQLEQNLEADGPGDLDASLAQQASALGFGEHSPEIQKTVFMRGGSLDGTEREIRGVWVEQSLMREDGLHLERYTWQTGDDGLIYGRFEDVNKYGPPTPEEEAALYADDGYDVAAHAFLRDHNEARVAAIEERTQGQVKLAHAFDSVKAVTYLKHVLMELGGLDAADFDYEGQRAQLLDETEAEIAAFESKRDDALARARLMGQPNAASGPRIITPGG